MMKTKTVLVMAALAGLALVVRLAWPEADSADVVRQTGTAHRLGKKTPVMRTPKERTRKVRQDPVLRLDKEKSKELLADYRLEDDGSIDFGEFDSFTGDDGVLVRQMEKAFWDDDKETVLAAAMEAATSDNAELRERAIEKAAWYGADGMDALVCFFMDKDEALAEQAREAWVEGLGQIEDDETRVAMVEPMCRLMTDPDMIDGMLMSLNTLPNVAQLQAIVSLMDTGTDAAAEAAREHYTVVTGEEFTTVEAAQQWLDENWEDDDEAYANGESVEAVQDRKFEKETYADIDEAAAKLGVKSEQLENLLGDEAAAEGMSGEKFVRQLNMTAHEEGMSTADYLTDRLKGQLPTDNAPEN